MLPPKGSRPAQLQSCVVACATIFDSPHHAESDRDRFQPGSKRTTNPPTLAPDGTRDPPDRTGSWPNSGEKKSTTRQRNTHNTESREVRYPWHPWFGRLVTVYETVTKGGHPLCRCGIEDQRNDRSVEVPAWMFEPTACDHLHLTATPFVDCQALIELKAVLQTAPRADVLQAPHHSLDCSGRC